MSGRSSCPECGTILRIRDRSFVGRRVSCPECKAALRIASEDEQGRFVARQLTPDELAKSDPHPRTTGKASRDKIFVSERQLKRSIFDHLFDSPLTAAWLLAIAISVLVAVLALAPKYRLAAKPTASSDAPAPVMEPQEGSTASEVHPEELPSDVTDDLNQKAEIPMTDVDSVAASAVEPDNVDTAAEASTTEEPELASEPPAETPPAPIKIDVETKLLQKLVSYKQSKPASRRDLIEALQEHLGAPILYNNEELGPTDLDKTITFELENTTIGDVIRKVADSAGWKILVEETGLRLTGQ